MESATKKKLAAFLRQVEGRRAPEIPKVARRFENAVERTPPYHPELQPIEYSRAHGKAEYATRYEGDKVDEFMQRFFDCVPESELLKTVSHCDKVAARLQFPQVALVIDDDMAPEEEEGDEGPAAGAAGWRDLGDMWRRADRDRGNAWLRGNSAAYGCVCVWLFALARAYAFSACVWFVRRCVSHVLLPRGCE